MRAVQHTTVRASASSSQGWYVVWASECAAWLVEHVVVDASASQCGLCCCRPDSSNGIHGGWNATCLLETNSIQEMRGGLPSWRDRVAEGAASGHDGSHAEGCKCTDTQQFTQEHQSACNFEYSEWVAARLQVHIRTPFGVITDVLSSESRLVPTPVFVDCHPVSACFVRASAQRFPQYKDVFAIGLHGVVPCAEIL